MNSGTALRNPLVQPHRFTDEKSEREWGFQGHTAVVSRAPIDLLNVWLQVYTMPAMSPVLLPAPYSQGPCFQVLDTDLPRMIYQKYGLIPQHLRPSAKCCNLKDAP